MSIIRPLIDAGPICLPLKSPKRDSNSIGFSFCATKESFKNKTAQNEKNIAFFI